MSTDLPVPAAWWGADTALNFPDFADQFAQTFGNLPTFMGRYTHNYVPSGQELAYYPAHHMATLLICNGEDGSTSNGTYSDGFLLGAQAAASAHRLGYPAHCFLPIDIEAEYQLSATYLLGYFHGVDQGHYIPGAYLDALNSNHVAAWIAARKQFSLPAYIYSSEPEPFALWDQVNPTFYDFSQTALGSHYGPDVLFWQYGEAELTDRVDLDVATDKGYHLLWQPPNPLTMAKVHEAGALKTAPNHSCPSAIDPEKRPVNLEPGVMVSLTGKRTPHWSEVCVLQSPVHGWFLTDHLQGMP